MASLSHMVKLGNCEARFFALYRTTVATDAIQRRVAVTSWNFKDYNPFSVYPRFTACNSIANFLFEFKFSERDVIFYYDLESPDLGLTAIRCISWHLDTPAVLYLLPAQTPQRAVQAHHIYYGGSPPLKYTTRAITLYQARPPLILLFKNDGRRRFRSCG